MALILQYISYTAAAAAAIPHILSYGTMHALRALGLQLTAAVLLLRLC